MKRIMLKLSAAVICFSLIIAAVPFSVSAETNEIYVSAQSIKNNGTAPAIQQALNLAEKQGRESDNVIKVVVEPGSYELNSSLHIFDNTWLSLCDVTIIRGENGSTMLRTGYDETENTGVTGYRYRNITIEGGTFDGNFSSETMLKIAHAKNFVMKNVRIQNNKNAHMMEVAGVDGFTAEGCGFYNQIMEVGNVGYEAIQLDVLKYGNIYYCRSEDLAMKNVLIENCVFSNVPRGIGSHTSVHNNPHDTFIIRNNQFKDIGSVAIQTLGWVNCSISNNTIDNAPRAIAVYSIVSEGYGTILPSVLAKEGETEQHYPDSYKQTVSNILIANNLITNGGLNNDKYASYEKAAITVMGSKVVNSPEYSGGSGKLPAGDYPCNTVTIKNNLMYLKNGTGLRVEHSKNISIDSNVMFCAMSTAPPNYYGVVFRDGVSSANIIKNYISNAAVNGVMVDSSSIGYISGNEIIGTGKYGIGTYASAIGTIQNNDIRNAKSEGISVLNGSNVSTKISENRISGSTSGIHIMANAAAKLIDKNLTFNCKSNIDYTKSSKIVTEGVNYTANAALSTFTVDSKALNLKTGECWRIGKSVVPVNAITSFTYASSNPDVAIVDSTGRITAKSTGTANVTVRSANGRALIITVNVNLKSTPSLTAAPANVRITNSETGFTVTWNEVAKAKQYTVYYRRAKSGSWTKYKVSTNSCKLNNLSAGELYYVQVQSLNSEGKEGGISNIAGMTHVRPTNLYSTAYNSNATVTVKWNAAAGANGYAIAKKKAGDKSYTYIYTSVNAYTDRNVNCGTVYYYQIRPYYSDGKSAAYALWSNTKTITTLYKPTITSMNISASRLNINWNAIKGATAYKLAFKRTTDSAWNYRITTARYFNVSNPTKGATYVAQVCPLSGSLAGTYSDPKSAGLAVPVTLAKPVVYEFEDYGNRLQAEWNRVPGAAYYKIAYKTAQESGWHYANENTTEFDLYSFKKDTLYYIQVAAVGSSGQSGPWSNPVSCRSGAGATQKLSANDYEAAVGYMEETTK